VVDDPIPPGPDPIPPGPGRPEPSPPDPGPEPPWPDPFPEPEPRPDDGIATRMVPADVVVELNGSVAVLSGVVERAEDRARIVQEVASLTSVTRVESNLQPSPA
jgi:hypothetical protein